MSLSKFTDPRLTWINEPSSWNINDDTGMTEGSNGKVELLTDDELIIRPPAYKDFWRRTFYSPLLIKNDGSALVCQISSQQECTVQVDFEMSPKSQFDQAGLLIYIDDCHWLKCGIEFCDGLPRLSCVVCNVYSDWSTQVWSSTGARLRVHKILQSSSVLLEAAPLGSDDFHFFRIAHLSSRASHRGVEHANEAAAQGTDDDLPWQVGPTAICAMAQKGFSARFTKFSVGPRLPSVHSTDASGMV